MLVCDKGVPHMGHGTLSVLWFSQIALQWRHNGHNGVSNHQPHDCLLNPLPRRRSKKTSKLRVTGFCAGNKWPVTRKMFPFDDVIMVYGILIMCSVFVSKGLIISSVFTCSYQHGKNTVSLLLDTKDILTAMRPGKRWAAVTENRDLSWC